MERLSKLASSRSIHVSHECARKYRIPAEVPSFSCYLRADVRVDCDLMRNGGDQGGFGFVEEGA